MAPASMHGTATCTLGADGGGACGVSCSMGYHACGGDCFADTDAPSTASDSCILTETYGVFVSPGGNDTTGNGSRAMPFATVGHAMTMAAMGTKRVYACGSAGNYTENLAVTASVDGVTVYGGLDCTTPATWTYAASKLATVAPATGYALQVSGLTTGVTFEDFAFTAADVTAAGASSIAVFVANAQNVAFHRTTLTAGNASATGASGGPGSNHFAGSLDGNPGSGTTGGTAKGCACRDGVTSSTGGQGGDATHIPGAGLPAYGGGTAGTNLLSCSMPGAVGGDGSDAPAGTTDPPSTSHGTLTVNGWTPAAGVSGSTGAPGQGGGGGGDRTATAAGGGGACGGCGGGGGTPGSGGGSSIALLAYKSGVALVGCTLTGKNAGDGGIGGGGEQGQAGGGGGGVQSGGGCTGGYGGSGAGGNGAQGGAGGLSLAIAYSGTAPSADSTTTMNFGTKGNGGAGGSAGPVAGGGTSPQPGAMGAQGPDGAAQATMPL
jgi:hypothetical protein